MDSKNRLFISIAVIALIIVAMVTSFGRSLFFLNTPSVELPDVGSGTGDSSASASHPEDGQYQTISVTPDTVQGVIASLSRSDSYYRELTVDTFWAQGEGSSSTTAQVWTDDGWTHSRRILPSGAIRHDLVGEDTLYYWYEGSQQYKQMPADTRSADLAQRIPTYETVLDLEPDTISSASFELHEDIPCIFVKTDDGAGRSEQYWVSVNSGLLICAEAEEEGELVYRMTAYSAVTTPCPPTASFSLPGGQALHSTS